MYVRLGEICDFQSGGTPSKNNQKFFDGDIPWITTVALKGLGIDGSDAVNWITEEAIKQSAAKIVPANSIMIGTRVGVGKVAINLVDMSTSQDIVSLIGIDETRWCKEYLCKCLIGKSQYLNSQARGATIKGIKIDTLANLKIPEISIEKQYEVSRIIDKTRIIIEQRKQELMNLNELMKARFVELFGDPIKNPKGWDVVKLSKCLERIDNGKSFTCDSNAREGAFPAILKLSAATYGDYRPYENKALLEETQFVESVEVHRGDLLFTRKNTPDLVGMAAYVFETPEKLMMPDLIFRLVTNERMTPIFLWQLINNREFRPVIQGISGGSAKSMSNISKERLKNIEVICPPISEQKKLEGVLEQVDKSKVAVQKALDETQLLFDSLMQQYFG